MDVATLVDVIGNLAAVVAAVGVLVVNAKLDKVIGRVDELVGVVGRAAGAAR